MVIDGFKSYAVRTVISGWDETFNSITGLNGSGKSNILDAICFVLGITNMSTVRAQNLQVHVPSSLYVLRHQGDTNVCFLLGPHLQAWTSWRHESQCNYRLRQQGQIQVPDRFRRICANLRYTTDRPRRHQQILDQRPPRTTADRPEPLPVRPVEYQQPQFLDHAGSYHKGSEYEGCRDPGNDRRGCRHTDV